MKLVLVVGLPASGKSTWAQRQVDSARAQGHVEHLLDDPRAASAVEEALERARSNCARVLYIVDPTFCDPSVLQAAQLRLSRESDLQTQVVYFENDLAQCEVNAVRRGLSDKSVLGALRRWAAVYHPPARAHPVYRP